MADLYACPRCDLTLTDTADGDPTYTELWVSWECDATFDPGVTAGDGNVRRWKVACSQGHVLALSDDYEQEDDESHAPPTRDQLASVGAVPWLYDRKTCGWVREEAGRG